MLSTELISRLRQEAVSIDNPAAAVMSAIANIQRDKINAQIKTCTRCSIASNCKSIICGQTDKAFILILSDYPNYQEVNSGEHFFPFENTEVLPVLKRLISLYTDPLNVAWCNVVNCYPTENKRLARPPTIAEITNCKSHVFNLINYLQVTGNLRCIMTMGSVALGALFPKFTIEVAKTQEQLDYFGTPVFPTYNLLYTVGNTERSSARQEAVVLDIMSMFQNLMQQYPDLPIHKPIEKF